MELGGCTQLSNALWKSLVLTLRNKKRERYVYDGSVAMKRVCRCCHAFLTFHSCLCLQVLTVTKDLVEERLKDVTMKADVSRYIL